MKKVLLSFPQNSQRNTTCLSFNKVTCLSKGCLTFGLVSYHRIKTYEEDVNVVFTFSVQYLLNLLLKVRFKNYIFQEVNHLINLFLKIFGTLVFRQIQLIV